MTAAPQRAPRSEYTFTGTRLLPVSRERVFECWTRAEHLCQWFGPRHYGVHSCEADARPGGIFRLCMRSPDGREYWVRGSYREVVRPERLVIECRADDEQGVEMLDEVIRVSLAAEGDATRLTIEASAGGTGPKAAAALKGMKQGWSETLDRLGERAGARAAKG